MLHMPENNSLLRGQTFMLDFSYPQNHLPPTSPANFKSRTPLPYSSTCLDTTNHPRTLPTLAEVNETTITECYIRYIIASDQNLDDSAYTTYQLARKFVAVPRTEGKVFHVWELFKLIIQLEAGKIKNWSQLVGKLGVVEVTGRPQYAQRVKRWMQSNKIDEFFAFILHGDRRTSSVNNPVRNSALNFNQKGPAYRPPQSQYPACYPTATAPPQSYPICEDRRRSFEAHASDPPRKRMRSSVDAHLAPLHFGSPNFPSHHQGPSHSHQFPHGNSDCILPPLRNTIAGSRSPTMNSDGTFMVSPVLEPSLNFSLPVPRLPTSPYASPILTPGKEFPSPPIPGLPAASTCRRFEDSYAPSFPYPYEGRTSPPASSDAIDPLRARIMENEQKTVELRRLLEDANREKVILKEDLERKDFQKMQQLQTFLDPRRIQ